MSNGQPQVMLGFQVRFTTDLGYYALQIQPSTVTSGKFEVIQMLVLKAGNWKATKATAGSTTLGVELDQVLWMDCSGQVTSFGRVMSIEKVTCAMPRHA